MPQLPNGAFGPIPASVVLDGNGTGSVTFQPNGKNARITNLFGKVSTANNQATVNVYLGQVADSNRVFNNNSGSTGFSANGAIDVNDGQTLYVVWTGGDPGANASATFSGTTIPFGQEGFGNGFYMDAADPIAAGDGTLIFPALRSPDYVTGISGWIMRRDGSVEFSDAVVRGSVSAGNGTVILNSSGLFVQRDINNPGQTVQVTRSAGLAVTSIQNGKAQLDTYTSSGRPYMALQAPTPTVLGTDIEASQTDVGVVQAGSEETAYLRLRTPYPSSVGLAGSAALLMFSRGTIDDLSQAQINADVFYVPELLNGNDGSAYIRAQKGTVTTNMAASAGTTFGPFSFPNAFPVGVIPQMFANLDSGAGAAVNFIAKPISITNTQFFIRVQNPGGAAATFNSTSSWMALYP